MELLNIFKKPILGYEKDMNEYECKNFISLTNSIKNGLQPFIVLSAYFKNKDSVYRVLDETWLKCIKHNIYTGYKLNKILINQIPNFSLESFIKNEFNFTIRQNKEFMNYSYRKLLTLCELEIAMYITKYGYDNFYYFEFRAMIINLLFKYFNCANIVINKFDETIEWSFTVEELYNIIYELENKDLDFYKSLAKRYNMVPNKSIVKEIQNPNIFNIKRLPKSREELELLITDNMSAAEKYKVIMDNYDVNSTTTARRILREYGFTRKYDIKSHIEETKEEIIDNINSGVQTLKNNNDKNTAELIDEVKKLTAEVKRLSNNYERLVTAFSDSINISKKEHTRIKIRTGWSDAAFTEEFVKLVNTDIDKLIENIKEDAN